MSVSIIVNPISGGASPEKGRRRAELASEVLDQARETGDVSVTERRGHARELASAAVRRGARLVIAWGGDGTMNEVASALAFTSTPLGLVAAGSGNGLARELGVSRRPEQAIRSALAARPRAIDLGDANGRLFVNMAGVGFDAFVAAAFDSASNRRRGLSTYVGIATRALFSYKPDRYAVSVGGDRREASAILVTFANSRQFGNGALIAPRARIDDGRLDLVVVEERARWRTVCQVPRLFSGSLERMREYVTQPFDHAIVETDAPMTFHVDGEPVQTGTRLEVRVRPGALRVAV